MAFWSRQSGAKLFFSGITGISYTTGPENDKIWNQYRDFPGAVYQAFLLYHNLAEFGCSPFRTLVNFRAARIAGGEASVKVKQSATATIKWLENFKAVNSFEQLISQMAILAEMQGQSFQPLKYDSEIKQVRVSALPLIDTASKNEAVGETIYSYKYIEDKFLVKGKPVSDYVFLCYNPIKPYYSDNGLIYSPCTAQSLLTECQTIDEVKQKIKRINRLYAKPTLVLLFENEESQAKFDAWIQKKINSGEKTFELGQIISTFNCRDVKFVQPDNAGVEGLLLQKKDLAKDISGTGGVPLHKLGYPEEMGSGRATAQVSEDVALLEFCIRELEKALLEMLRKAAEIMNAKSNLSLEPLAIEKVELPLTIPELMEAKMERLQKDREKKNISLETYLENHPDISDVPKEIERISTENVNLISKLQGAFGNG